MKCPHCYQEIKSVGDSAANPPSVMLMALADAAIAYAADNLDLGDLRRIALDYAERVKRK